MLRFISLFGKDDEGEYRVHVGRGDKRLSLYMPKQTLELQWSGRKNHCQMSIELSDVDDSDLTISLGIPLIGAIWLMVYQAKWVNRLPGVKWKGQYDTGEREIRVTVHDGAIWWRLWRHPHQHKARDWRDGNFNPADFFLGRQKYSKSNFRTSETHIAMPEGVYPATIELYDATWKRPRWPKVKTIARANIEVKGGAPVPGKGENSWDMDDDAVYSMTMAADTVDEAKKAFVVSVKRDRERYAGVGWEPADGWPDHCVNSL